MSRILREFARALIVAITMMMVTLEARAWDGRRGEPQVVYVDDSATGLNNGTSWANAYVDLQMALSGPLPATPAYDVEVRVAQGIYKPTTGLGRGVSFILSAETEVHGGYAGVGAPNPDTRDPVAYPTILSGDLSSNDGINFSNYGENSFNIVDCTFADLTTVLDGFIIRGGNANGSGINGETSGGGLTNQAGGAGSPVVRNCVFTLNSALQGAAAHVGGGTVQFINCQFNNNRETSAGGGALNQSAGTLTLTDCTFTANTSAQSGGAIRRGGGTLSMSGCTFETNLAAGDGGAIEAVGTGSLTCIECTFDDNETTGGSSDGGAIRWGATTGTLTLTDCEFTGNQSSFRGGAVSLSAGSGMMTLEGGAFNGNHADSLGGAIFMNASSPSISGCAFDANTCPDGGGAIFAQNGSGPMLQNCTFTGNAVTPTGGGAAYFALSSPQIADCDFTGNSAASAGGALYVTDGSNAIISGSTFLDNDAGINGGAIHFSGNGTASISNTGFSSNSAVGNGGAVNNNGSSPIFRGCQFTDNAALNGGANFNFNGARPKFILCDFVGNAANPPNGSAGAIFNDTDSDMIAVNCRFLGNSAAGSGGVMINHTFSDPTITGSLFHGNIAGGSGGVLFSLVSSAPTLINCTVTSNSAATFAGGLHSEQSSTATVRNSVLWGNLSGNQVGQNAQVSSQSGGSTSISVCMIEGWTGSLPGTGGSGFDPMLIDVNGVDNILGTLDDNARMDRRSLGIDRANPSLLPNDAFDIDGDSNTAEPLPLDVYGQPRIVDCLDIGAAEYDGVSINLAPSTFCDGGSSGACFMGLGMLPITTGTPYSFATGISSDGLRVSGFGRSAALGHNDEGFVRSASGILGVGDLTTGNQLSRGLRISGDGRWIVGWSYVFANGNNFGNEALQWDACAGNHGLGDLSGGNYESQAYGASHDGGVVVGYSRSVNGYEAFRWTDAGGMVGLGDLPGSSFFSEARDVSANGDVIVGRSQATLGAEAFIWTQPTGVFSIGQLPGGSHYSLAYAVNDAGDVVVGESSSTSGTEAFRWTDASGTMTGLGDLPDGGFFSSARDVSDSGNVIVGMGSAESGQAAFIWDSAAGMRNLRTLLIDEFGLSSELALWNLQDATGVSADGLTIVGLGVNPAGQTEGWIAHLPFIPPPPCPADIDDNTVVDTDDLLALLGSWGPCVNCAACPADIAPAIRNCAVDTDDLLMMLGSWGACP